MPGVFTDQVRESVMPEESSWIRSRISPKRKNARTSYDPLRTTLSAGRSCPFQKNLYGTESFTPVSETILMLRESG